MSGPCQAPFREYDQLNRPKKVTDALNHRNDVTEVKRYSDLTATTLVGSTVYALDDARRLTSITHKNGSGTTIDSYSYQYDNADRVTQETSTLGPTRNKNGFQKLLAVHPSRIALPEGLFVTSAPAGYPVEMIPWHGRREYAGPGWALALHEQVAGDAVVREAVLREQGRETLRIRQVWGAGEPWWREYERYVDGRKDLTARRADLPLALRKKPGGTGVGGTGVGGTGGPAAAAAIPNLHLRSDPRLQVPVAVDNVDARFSTILARVESATGLGLSVADNLKEHDPSLGRLQLSKAKAWQIMELLAALHMERGRWDKTDTGYRLTGTSIAPQPPPGRPYVALPTIVLAVAAAVLGLVLVRKRMTERGSGPKPAAARSPEQPAAPPTPGTR